MRAVEVRKWEKVEECETEGEGNNVPVCRREEGKMISDGLLVASTRRGGRTNRISPSSEARKLGSTSTVGYTPIRSLSRINN